MILHFACTVDVDNDGLSLCNQRNELSWQGVGNVFSVHEAFAGVGAPVTWFVRADNQLHDVYGSANYLLHAYAELWDTLEAAGDEIAWHPHIYEWLEEESTYVPDLVPVRCAGKLRKIHAELAAAGFRPAVVRMGEAYHSNETMAAVAELGLSCDSTALPGRTRCDDARRFDWAGTPNRPYFPAIADYRLEGGRDSSLNILEIPLTTVPVRAPYDEHPGLRYLNFAYRHEIFCSSFDLHLDGLKSGPDAEAVVTAVVHVDEVGRGAVVNGLYSGSLNVVRENLRYVQRAIRERSWSLEFVRISSVRQLVTHPPLTTAGEHV